jgi:glycosyltransferase involved in cell wall biosynthesis
VSAVAPGRPSAVSLVVPVRDEETSLDALIESIRAQTRLPDEVLLVDGGSIDRTVELASQLTAGDERFRVLLAGEATPGRGRNVGIAAARHDWIALTDAGISLEPTWLERLLDVVEAHPHVAVVYGNFEPMTRTPFERWAALAYPPPRRLRPGGEMRGPSVASMLLRREVHAAVGGFPDLRATEDRIFLERLDERGFDVGWAPTATVWWQLQPTLSRTFRKFVTYSKQNVQAGRQRYWHYGVARQYLAGLVFVGLAFAINPAWITAPMLGALARVGKNIWARREGRSLRWLLNPAQFVGVGVLLATIDCATFLGWAQALLERKVAARPTRSIESPGGAGSGSGTREDSHVQMVQAAGESQ